jgi:CelD/BcsL family acetyltransferase involved in cellulose biosynthesis
LARLSAPLIGGPFTDALFDIHQQYGLTILLQSKSKLIAAYLVTIAGHRCEFWTTAYDADYSKYWLGNLAGIEAVRAAIERGCNQFNFLWGLTDHKLMLGGKPERLYHFIQARNHVSYMSAFLQFRFYHPLNSFINRGFRFLRRRLQRLMR